MKKKFYSQVEHFWDAGYDPKGLIDKESVNKLNNYKSLEWTIEDNVENIKTYLHSLKPKY